MKANTTKSAKSAKSAAIDNEKAIEAAAIAQQIAKDKAAAKSAPKSAAPKSPKSTAPKTTPAPIVTPQASVDLFESLKPAFADATKSWLVGAKSGALVFSARVADVRVIAACLLSKLDALPIAKEGDVDKDSIKIVRASFNKLSTEGKAKWEAKALPLFKSALKDYHSATAPLKKLVFSSSKFSIRSLRVGVAKKTGNVSVTSRHLALGSDL